MDNVVLLYIDTKCVCVQVVPTHSYIFFDIYMDSNNIIKEKGYKVGYQPNNIVHGQQYFYNTYHIYTCLENCLSSSSSSCLYLLKFVLSVGVVTLGELYIVYMFMFYIYVMMYICQILDRMGKLRCALHSTICMFLLCRLFIVHIGY